LLIQELPHFFGVQFLFDFRLDIGYGGASLTQPITGYARRFGQAFRAYHQQGDQADHDYFRKTDIKHGGLCLVFFGLFLRDFTFQGFSLFVSQSLILATVFHGTTEIFNGIPQIATHIFQALGAEHQNDDNQYD
jgi:hypothetical protein